MVLIKNSIFKLSAPLLRPKYSNLNSLNPTATMGMTTTDIIGCLQAFAPLTLAESWDNVGLLVDPMNDKKIQRILLTNDLTEDVVKEAIKIHSGLIISYHPNIFQGLKSVSSKTWKERIVVQCIKHNIGVFSPHTSWDAVDGGVNDWLARSLPFSAIKPIKETPENPNRGAGRLLKLASPIPVQEIVQMVKKQIGIPHVRLALARHKLSDDLVSTVALCAGSGNSVVSGVDADLYLTGEMLHHDILDATQNGVHVILCNHSDSERGFLREFREILQTKILDGAVEVAVSKIDKDPLFTV